MAVTRAEFDSAKLALGQAIRDAADRVVATIEELKQQIAIGNPVTETDLQDVQNDILALGAIDAQAVPPPGK